MGHGGHGKRKVPGKPAHSSKGLKMQHPRQSEKKKKKKTKVASIKNKIRSVERLLSKDLPNDVKAVQLKRLEELKKQDGKHKRTELERKMAVRYHKVKFFERRKIDRGIKRLEKLQSADNLDENSARQIGDELRQLKEDLEYVRFFPKTEKYISLFMGSEDEEVIAKRKKLREQIKANLAAMAAKGLEPEEMESEEDQPAVISDDDFFLAGSSSDDEAAHGKMPPKSTKLEGRSFMSIKHPPQPFARHGNKQSKTQRLPKLTPQSHDKRQSTGSHNKNKRSESNGQGQPTIHTHKRKYDQRHHMAGGDDKSKKQKTHVLSPSLFSRPSSNHSKGLQLGNQQANNDVFKGASTMPSPASKAVVVDGPPRGISNAPMVMDTANPDVKKKRKRKHRPKKKK